MGAVPSEKVVAYHYQRMKFYVVPFLKSSTHLLSDTAFTSRSSVQLSSISQQRINPGRGGAERRHNFLSRSAGLIISGSRLPWRQLREMGRNGKRKLQEEGPFQQQ